MADHDEGGGSADDLAPDAVFKFSLVRTTNVAIDTAGTSFDSVISLHASAPVLRDDFEPSELERAAARHNETCLFDCAYPNR